MTSATQCFVKGMACGRLLLLATLLAGALHDSAAMDMCINYPSPDPCLPGGTWDPVVSSCTGYSGLSCYQCHSGQFCKERQDTKSCELHAGEGNPIFIVEYWRNKSHHDPCTGVLGHYRPGYQLYDSGNDLIFPPLEESIRAIHAVTGNAETEGYEIIPGMGATMVLHTVIIALSEKILDECTSNCPAVVDVMVQAPMYPAYESIVSLVKTARWNISANTSSPYTIEILTYPNNPSGERRNPVVKDASHVIRDMVYYWPSYTHTDVKFAEPIMVFSSSKHDGLAGTRFGWGLIKDLDLAKRMVTTLWKMVIAFSADIQLRVLSSMERILAEPRTADGMIAFHAYTRDVMTSRFERLRVALTCAKLTNSYTSTGGFAWVQCLEGNKTSAESCLEFFAKGGVVGERGTAFGATEQFVRFSMLMPSIEFDILIEKVKIICSNN